MQHQQDRTTAEALTSFTTALATAQQQLQREECRLLKSTAALATLRAESDSIKRTLLNNPQQQHKIETLKRERMKMTHCIRQQREECARESDHMVTVRQQRSTTEAAIETSRQRVSAARNGYVRRAAAVHSAVVVQSFAGATGQVHLQEQRQRLCGLREELVRLEGRVAEAGQRRALAMAALQAVTTTAAVVTADEETDAAAAAAIAPTGKGSGTDTDKPPSRDADDEENADADGGVAALEARLVASRSAHAAAHSAHEATIAALRAAREALKGSLRGLCTAVEEADAEQQRSQQRWDAALNDIGSVTSGGGGGGGRQHPCMRCGAADITEGLC